MTAVLVVFVGAPLLDKSFVELVAWGDEEMAGGNPDVAAQVFMRALKNASEADKMLVVDRIVQTRRSMDDPKAAVEMAMRVIDVVSAESFGRHNYLVAKELVAREPAASTGSRFHPAPQRAYRAPGRYTRLAGRSRSPSRCCQAGAPAGAYGRAD